MLQKLLLLPELHDVAITGTNNSDPLKITSRSTSPTLKLNNEEMVNDSGDGLFSTGIKNQARVSVNSLTASWTHVSLPTVWLMK